jgi:hypothetical protein
MKTNNNIITNIAETSKIGFAGILAGAFCLIFAVIYTIVYYARGENK